MGVYIPDMEMPTDCGHCRFAVDGWCYAYGKPNIDALANDGRTNFCPLIPVPPHGELCDKTALVNKIGENIDKAKDRSYDWWYACTVAYDFALAAPTIIPAEEGET